MRDPELSIAGWVLLGEARTLRERAFCRTVQGLDHDSIKFAHTPEQIFQIHPVEPSVNGLMSACAANTWSRDRLSAIPISRLGRSALSDPELVPMLRTWQTSWPWRPTRRSPSLITRAFRMCRCRTSMSKS